MLKTIRLNGASLILPLWLWLCLPLPIIIFLGIFSVCFIKSDGSLQIILILCAVFPAGLNLLNTMLTLVFWHYQKNTHMAILGILAACSAFSQIYSFFVITQPSIYQPVWSYLSITICCIFFFAFISVLFKIKWPAAIDGAIFYIILLYGSSVSAMSGTIAVYGSVISLFLSLFFQSLAGAWHFKVLWTVFSESPLRAVLRRSKLQHSIITKQKTGLKVLKKTDLILESLGNISSKLISEEKLTPMLEMIINESADSLGSEHIFFSMLEENSQMLWVVANKSTFKPCDVPFKSKFMGHLYEAGKIAEIYDLTECPNIAPEILQIGLNAMLGLPIMVDNTLVGVLEVFFKDSGCISARRKKLAAYYASQIALSIKVFNQNEKLAKLSSEFSLLQESAKIVANQSSSNLLLLRTGKLLADFLWADGFAAYLAKDHATFPELQEIQIENFPSPDIARLKSWFFSTPLPTLHQGQSTLITLTLSQAKTIQVLPLIIHQKFLGFIAFSWDYERETKLNPLIEDTLKTVASQAAMGLDRDRLYGSIQKIGLTDTLTTLANRRFFDFILNRETNLFRRHKRPLSLLMIDIDFFKKINDTYGHQTGDFVLKELGELIKRFFRATDLPARYGGEEFAVILPETGTEPSAALAEELRTQVQKKLFSYQNNCLSLTVSIGVATLIANKYIRELPTGADLILAADQALYRAKEGGRNRVECM